MDPGTQVQNFNQAVAQKPDLIVARDPRHRGRWSCRSRRPSRPASRCSLFDGRPDPSVDGRRDVGALGQREARRVRRAEPHRGPEGARAATSGNIIVLTGTKSDAGHPGPDEGLRQGDGDRPQYKVIDEQDANWDPHAVRHDRPAAVRQVRLRRRPGRLRHGRLHGAADHPGGQAGRLRGRRQGRPDRHRAATASRPASTPSRPASSTAPPPRTPARSPSRPPTTSCGTSTARSRRRARLVKEERVTAANVDEFAEQCSHA